jgi:hypothetical protein
MTARLILYRFVRAGAPEKVVRFVSLFLAQLIVMQECAV